MIQGLSNHELNWNATWLGPKLTFLAETSIRSKSEMKNLCFSRYGVYSVIIMFDYVI